MKKKKTKPVTVPPCEHEVDHDRERLIALLTNAIDLLRDTDPRRR